MNVKRGREEHPVQDFFNYDAVNDISKCNVVNCDYSASGRHSNNLTKHIQRHHPNKIVALDNAMKEFKSRSKKSRASGSQDYIVVKINKKEFQNGLLEMVNINGRPFNILKDSGMLKVITPILDAFKNVDQAVSISRETLQKESLQKCANLTEYISKEMQGKVFAICIDMGQTHDGRSVMAVNAQYYYKKKWVSRCLAMQVHRKTSSAIRLAIIIWNVLKKFKLNIQKLISITTDNGANVLKCVKVLQILQSGILNDFVELDDIDYDILERAVDDQLSKRLPSDPFLHGLKCFAHTLNLCISDAMEGNKNDYFTNWNSNLIFFDIN